MTTERSAAFPDPDSRGHGACIAGSLGLASAAPPPKAATLPRVRWQRPSLNLTEEARQHILELADTCSALSDQMRLMAEAVGPGQRGSLAAKPAFREIVSDFSAAIHLLTAAIDTCETATPPTPWRHLIADSRLLQSLEKGIEAERRHLLALALQKWLAAQKK